MVRIRPYDLLDDLEARGVLDLRALDRRIAEVEAEYAALLRIRSVVVGDPPAVDPPRPVARRVRPVVTRTKAFRRPPATPAPIPAVVAQDAPAGRTVAQDEVSAARPPIKPRSPAHAAELELIARAQAGEHAAREQLVENLLPGIRGMASKLALGRGHVSLEDLIQEGAIAVLDVLERYDSARGWRFTTFAQPRIHGAMQDYCRSKLNLTQGGGRGRREEYSHFSLLAKQPEHSKGKEQVYEIADRSAEEERDNAAALERFHELLRGCNDTERAIMVWYYRGDLTMKEIGENLRLSESRVSQIHSSVIGRLRGSSAG